MVWLCVSVGMSGWGEFCEAASGLENYLLKRHQIKHVSCSTAAIQKGK